MELLNNKQFRLLLLSLLLVLPLEFLSFFSFHFPIWFELPFFLLIILYIGRSVFRSGIKSLVHFNFADINLLMTIAIIGALYLQQFEEATIIVILFSLGNVLEDFGIERSQKALQELVAKTPKSALVKGEKDKTPIDQIKLGEIVVIKPGDYIPLDGDVVEGRSLVDETAITGEPLPKNKYIGDTVYGGTLNGQGYLEVKVTKTASDTTIAKIIDLTYQALEKKSHSQQFIELFAQYYTPSVLIIAVLLVVIPVFVLGQPFQHWFTEALTLLLISCPCALVISTPISIFSAIGNASKKGVIIKGGKFLEEIGKVKAIAFDKTRTLTKGEPIVSDVIPLNGVSKEELLADIAGVEVYSEHPLAKSMIAKTDEENISSHPFVNFEAVMGKGIKGECTVCVDKHHCIGTIQFITEQHKVSDKIIKQVEKFEQEGKTAVVLSDNKNVEGIIGITDAIRPESKSVINELKKYGITPIMLTGDNLSAASYVAEQVGISEVKAALLPENKATEIQRLMGKYHTVAMIGDGINDAPALAISSVGIAMGAIGSDVAVENADIAFMNTNLSLTPYLIRLGRNTLKTIRTNIALAVGVKSLFLLLAVIGKSNLAFAIFADVGVTLIVVLNGLRLYGKKFR